ncbi:MAG: methylated-DNA--[protein]-cysteine S-methyltransferase [Anaerolineaceae bacterium]
MESISEYARELKNTPIGPVTLTGTLSCLYSLHFCSLEQLKEKYPGWAPVNGEKSPALCDAADQLLEYFARKRKEFSIELNVKSRTPFQQHILSITQQIPYGQTITYSGLARLSGSPLAARAIGAAMASNPIPIFIPCHRVIGSDRSLHGFAAPDGIATKAILLKLEGNNLVGEKLA